MTVKIICFNGAPGSGKSTGVDYLEKAFHLSAVLIASPIKRLVATIYKFPTIASLDEEKDTPHPQLYGKTPRKCYIAHGEMMKSFHRESFWIDQAIANIKTMEQLNPFPVYAIPDVGFQIEIDRLIELFGVKNILLIYIEREGCNYENDSRSKVFAPDKLATARIYNDRTIKDYQRNLHIIIEDWLNG
jgi:hypothetical protein